MAIKCAAMDNFVHMGVSLVCTLRIEFNRISTNAYSCRNRRNCCAGSRARVQHRGLQSGKSQPSRYSPGFFVRERVIAEFQSCLRSQIVTPFCVVRERDRVLLCA